MLCIAAFLVILVLAAVSAKYRRLLGRAWGCTWRRVTLRACDTSFGEDLKNSMLAPLAVRAPRLVKPASIGIEVAAWVMVVSMIVSLFIVGRSGLNLFVYGTCDKENAQACSLSSEACSIESTEPAFWDSVARGDVFGAFGDEFSSLGETIAAVPSRLKTWDAAEYAPAYATYLQGYREELPVAVEVIDPGCSVCAQLFRNIEESGIAETHNLTYIAYPIDGAYASKFPHSPLVASYLTAVRIHEDGRAAEGAETADWHILRQIFTGSNAEGVGWQVWLNQEATPEQAEGQLQDWLREAGYQDADLADVERLVDSQQVADLLAANRTTVEDDIRTVKIPSLIIEGRLHAGLVDTPELEGMN
ncbi:MAG TPA: hypothetical protein VM430_05425 [Microbacterium sp.]|nr:hypothetical protein [Microbacterium sp.]